MQTHYKPRLSNFFPLLFLTLFYTPSSAQEMWGMTKYGGAYDKGVIFKMDENASSQEVVFSFETVKNPSGGLTEYENNVFYGLSQWGGKYDGGVIYKFELDEGKFTKIFDFEGETTGRVGNDRMLYASNGKMYGATLYGGIHDKGTLFEFDPLTESFTRIFDFDGADNGAQPMGILLEGNDGKLYGTTASGGAGNDGVLFSYDMAAGEFAKLFDFESIVSGAAPVGGLIQHSDGKLYGMTQWGGAYDDGLIYSFNPDSGQYSVLLELDETITGCNPVAGFVTTPNGKIYGITPKRSPDDKGFVFEYLPPTNTFSEKVEFTALYNVGWVCVAAGNGKLYWLPDPGLHAPPTVISYDPENDTGLTEITASFGSREPALFFNSFMQASNGNLYFIANATQHDIRNENTLYEFNPVSDEFTNYIRFSGIETGEWPYGSLHQGADGMLYGTTFIGGAYHQGVIFEIDPETYNFTKLVDFERESKGAKPIGGIIQADNQKLYGLTSEGGAFDKGVLYEFDPVSGVYTKLTVFDGINGEHPDGDLVKAPNGKLYGVTVTGGTSGEGVLFEMDTETGSFKKLIDFQGVEFGSSPNSNALVAASGGNIYGTTSKGGLYDKGVLFEYSPADESFVKIIDYQETGTGSAPMDLIEGKDNMLYTTGGPGEITRIDPANVTYTKSVFDAYYLNYTSGRLLQANNGKFYWMDRGYIWYRATDFPGSIHEYDMETGTYREVLEFNWANGSNPENTSLIQLGDFSAPVAQCKNITLYLNESGEANLLAADIDNGSSGEGIKLTVSNSTFACEQVGENNVTLTATAENGNQAVCDALVSVLDTVAPAVKYKNVELYADAAGNAVLDAADVDYGSSDACGIQTMVLGKSSFSAEDIGENQVEYSVIDNNGNASSVMLTVTVKDTVAPEVVFMDTELYLDQTGMAALEAADIDNGSNDAFGIKSMALDKTIFSCEDAGMNTLVFSIEDNNGNVSSHPVVVTVSDSIAPEISCVNSTGQYLDPYGDGYRIDNSEWNAQASDNCAIESLSFVLNEIDDYDDVSLEGLTLNVGIHEVEWIAADSEGNTASCRTVIAIEKRPTILRITGKKVDPEHKVINVEAVLNDSILGYGIEGKQLVFSCDDVSATAVTSAEGVATTSLQMDDEMMETYTVEVKFREDATYTASLSEEEISTGTEVISVTALKVFPNPFDSRLFVEFTAHATADARIDLYDAAGRLVENIFNQPVVKGEFYRAEYLSDPAAGNILMYRIKIGATFISGKVIKADY